jgi:hypothetical protein
MDGSTTAHAGRTATVAFIVATSMVLVGCGDGGNDAPSVNPATTAPATVTPSDGGAVNVELQEFAVGVDSATAPAGEIAFNVTNTGPEDVHEFVIIRTDLALTDLPTDADGAVEEDKAGLEVIDEVEDLAVGATEPLDVNLDPGSYVFICNIVQTESDGTIEAHYAEGMRTSFTVA